MIIIINFLSEEIFSCSDVDDKDSIEIINQDSPVTAAMINSDYGFEKLDPVGRMLSSGALDDSWGLEGSSMFTNLRCQKRPLAPLM